MCSAPIPPRSGSDPESEPDPAPEGEDPGTPAAAGSEGYRAGSAGYRSPREVRHTPELIPEPDAVNETEDRRDPDAAFAAAETRRKQREERRRPELWLPGEEELDREPEQPEDTSFGVDDYVSGGSKQIGLRLRSRDFERLCQAAEVYGVRPTTLARMMVLRGVKAILDAERSDGR